MKNRKLNIKVLHPKHLCSITHTHKQQQQPPPHRFTKHQRSNHTTRIVPYIVHQLPALKVLVLEGGR